MNKIECSHDKRIKKAYYFNNQWFWLCRECSDHLRRKLEEDIEDEGSDLL